MKQEKHKSNIFRDSKTNLYLIVIIMLIASAAFRLINSWQFEKTSILFIGIPAFLAILVIKYTKTPKSVYGIVFKVITLFLLISSIFLGEGIVCVIFMAPIFYGVGALVALIYDLAKKKGKKKLFSLGIIPILLIISQPKEIYTKPPIQSVTTSVIVNDFVSLEEFNKQPNFYLNFPAFFKLGFPKPVAINGLGTQLYDTREIAFLSTTKGIGTLNLKVTERTQNKITFTPTSDNTHINHWLTWKQMDVTVNHLPNKQTEIIWTTDYYCDLGPSWYFLPFEQKAVRIMNKHLSNVYFKY